MKYVASIFNNNTQTLWLLFLCLLGWQPGCDYLRRAHAWEELCTDQWTGPRHSIPVQGAGPQQRRQRRSLQHRGTVWDLLWRYGGNNHCRRSSAGFVQWRISLMCASALFTSAGHPNPNTAVVLAAAVGGAAMLFIVVVVLFLRRRSVLLSLSFSLCPVNQLAYTLIYRLPLSFFCPSFVGPPNGRCIHSLLLSSLSYLSLPPLSVSVSQHSLGENLRWMSLVIAQWLHFSECRGFWKEIGPEWYIVGDKRRLLLSAADFRHFVKVTWACTQQCVASPSTSLPPACLSFSQLGKHSLSSAFIKGPLLSEWTHCTSDGILVHLEKLLQRLLCAIDIKEGRWYG